MDNIVKISKVGFNHVTVVAVKSEEGYNIGVARCGDKQKYNKELGIEIATNRANIQPFSNITNIENFDIENELVCNHIKNQKQVSLQNLKVIRK